MARPTKPRRVRHWPTVSEFRPNKRCKKSVLQLGVDEWEALYLKDVVKLSQEECAKMMDISRQTVQMILENAHYKVALAITSGYTLQISGGEVTLHHCLFQCKDCGHKREVLATDMDTFCPTCKSANTHCIIDHFCQNHCQREFEPEE